MQGKSAEEGNGSGQGWSIFLKVNAFGAFGSVRVCLCARKTWEFIKLCMVWKKWRALNSRKVGTAKRKDNCTIHSLPQGMVMATS